MYACCFHLRLMNDTHADGERYHKNVCVENQCWQNAFLGKPLWCGNVLSETELVVVSLREFENQNMSGINDTNGLASGSGIANNKSLPQSPASMVSSESETQSISDEQTATTIR